MMVFKRVLTIYILLFLSVSQSSFVYAQELATDSAKQSVATPSADIPFDATASSEASATSISVPLDSSGNLESSISALPVVADPIEDMVLGPSGVQNPSATIKQPPQVRNLRKRSFRANEQVTVVVDNAWEQDVTIELFDVDGVKQHFKMKTISDGDPLVLEVLPNEEFRSGRYRLVITDTKGNVTMQDFTWGVLAINTNKSIYKPEETAKLAIAVLDETGMMECDADITLTMKHEGNTDVLSTENGLIQRNDVCEQKIFTLIPDYEATYKTGSVGTYDMQLTAKTENGSYTITDAFEVRDTVPFDVERATATRIFPPATYPVTLAITFHEDFDGIIQEMVPGNFAVSAIDGAIPFTLSRLPMTQTDTDVLGASIIGLSKPFDHDRPISLGFGQQLRDPVLETKYSDFGLLGHDGIDFDMPINTAVLAVDDGVVVKTDQNGDYGTTLVIAHTWGKSYYGHLSLITKQLGDKVIKGHPVALSGNTGLSTAPHLHFGVKPNVNDSDNGYYGKINPWSLLSHAQDSEAVLSREQQAATLSATSEHVSDSAVLSVSTTTNAYDSSIIADKQLLTWNVHATKGETKLLGYQFQTPNISPQFYHLGPLTFLKSSGETMFLEGRLWQLAIDADGSGTNTVNPTTGTVSATGQTYTFTFTAGETMDSGGITIAVPSGWSAPQGTGGTAGYTTAVGSGNATVGRVLTSADSKTGWSEQGGADACTTANLKVDTTTKQEGSGSILCNNNSASQPDGGDGIAYSFPTENWSTLGYTQVGFWARSDDGMTTAEIDFVLDETTNCTSTQIMNANFSSALTADTWVYQKIALTGTLTDVESVCFLQVGNSADSDSYWIDDVLVGPATPTFSGSGPWIINVRLLDIASAETVTVVYGNTAGGAGSTVTNSSSAGVHTFTTQSRISDAGTLTNIGTSPTVTLSASGPTMDQLLRHGAWFNGSGVEQPFTF